MSAETYTCEICREAMHKYKCPRCLSKYCSVSCFKSHKESGCFPAKVNEAEQKKEISQATSCVDSTRQDLCNDEESLETEDHVSVQMLSKLGDSEELRILLRNPSLQDILTHIDQTNKPDIAIARAMQEPIFTEFADKCLSIVEPGNNNSMETVDLHLDSD